MNVRDLIAELSELPLDREVLVDVREVGFLQILGIDNDTENPAAAIMLEDNEAISAVREINVRSGSIFQAEVIVPEGWDLVAVEQAIRMGLRTTAAFNWKKNNPGVKFGDELPQEVVSSVNVLEVRHK